MVNKKPLKHLSLHYGRLSTTTLDWELRYNLASKESVMSPSFRYRQIALIGSFSSRDCERPSILVAVDLWTGTIGHIRHFGQISLNPNFLLTPRHSRSPPVYNWR